MLGAGQAHAYRPAALDVESFHIARRKVGDHELRGDAVDADAEPAQRTEKLDVLDAARERVRRGMLGAAHDHVLGAQKDGHRGAAAEIHRRAVRMQPHAADFERRVVAHHCREHVGLADEIGDERGRRLAIDFARRADLLDQPLVHDHHAVGDRQRFLLVVGDQDGGHPEALLQQADFAAQAHAHLRVERGQRLVEQQQARRSRERARQRNALLLAARQLPWIFRAAVGEPDQRQQFGDARAHLRLRQPPVHQSVRDVVVDRQVRKQRVRLEDDAVVAHHGRQPRDVAVVLAGWCRWSALRARR
jgi:hypothetical protein